MQIISEREAEETVVQVNQIINALGEEDKNKIPVNVRSFFKVNAKNIERYMLDLSKPFEVQNISGITKTMLKYIYSYVK